MFNPAYIGVVAIGLLHGLEPGHGWPVATLYSVRKKNVLFSAALSSGIIGLAHLVSSIAVVVAYVLVDEMEGQHGHLHEEQVEIEHDHEHEHPDEGTHTHRHKHLTGVAMGLWSLASFAFVLGFAHEEEFALLALVAGGANAWVLMIAYGVAVLVGLMAVTILCVKLYQRVEHRLKRYEKYVPKVGAAILVIMAAIIVVW
jgi:ABC-type nickel/cobalt efflux system permease component RcnA